ncbi:AAA family ATPase [soil metagenome]
MSVRSALVFKQLNIRRTPGIDSPFTVDGLTEGVNIAYGPNASGKSTTAGVLQMLLWNDLPGWSRASIAGRIDLDGSEWTVDIDAGALSARRDGAGGARLPVDVEHSDRYILTLHDLLQADNADFAGVILRESAGGYDIDAARDALGYRERPSQPRKNIGEFRSAQRETREARQSQQGLLREQQRLGELREQLEAAQAAVTLAGLLEQAIAARQRQRELDLAQETLDALPENISRLSGDELDRLKDIDERRTDYESRRRQAEAEIERASREIRETGLDGVTLPDGFIATLRTRVQQLQDLAGRINRAAAELAGQVEQRDRAARQLGRHISEEQLRDLEAEGLRRLVDLARRFEQARAGYEAANEMRSWLGAPAEFGDIDRLRQGISSLNGWLRSGGAPVEASDNAGSLMPAVVASVLIALIVLAGAVVGHPLFIGFIVLAIVPVALAFLRRSKPPASTGTASHFQSEYRRAGLEQPRSWNVEQVEALVSQLGQQLHQQQLAYARSERWAGLEDRWQEAQAAYQEADAEWRRALEATSLEPFDSAELYQLAGNLDRWQAADARVAAAQQQVALERQAHANLLDEINRNLALAGYPESDDHATAHGHINDLDERSQRLRSARQTRDNARSALEQTTIPELERLARERRAVFESAGLDVDDERTLADWIDQRDDYLEARKSVEQAALELRYATAQLGDHQHLIERGEPDLAAELESVRSDAARADQLRDDITRIETLIDQAKQARNLEQAIADEELAADVLRGDREEGYRLAAGWKLAEFVRQQTRDRDRPQVFHRARDLFVRMTQGRYVLQFSDDPSPAFRAIDTTTNVNHGLDELSSATRVQMLMAVRMAFVEEMEHGPKLPLILDETLGNADEHRAEAIIRAVCEISRSGRQVFYFTAQLDEVGKWRRLLSEHPDLPHCVISLVEARRLPEFERSVLEDLPPAAPAVPVPNGTTYHEYRNMLHVPPIDTRQDVEAVHLWYLVPDPDELHRLLTLGISTWGQLKALVEFGGEYVSEAVYGVARARAGVIDAAIRARRVGHGRPVDRAAVLNSDAFTDTFVDRVVREAGRADGDAETLLRRLDNGAVTRLRSDYIEDFRTYLTEHGYLDPDEPLDDGDVRARVLGAAGESVAAGLVVREDVEFLLGCVPPLET